MAAEHASPHLVEWLGESIAPAHDWDSLLGGKGAGLERLLRMGAQTPPGFCLTSDAFRLQLASGPMPPEAAIAALPDPAARDRLTALLTDAPMAEPIGEALRAGVTRLQAENDRFAVRSSAVGEDSRSASFAGIHDTELELSAAEVPGAVRRCWASLWSERAVEYRTVRGLAMDGAMAVVVQALVQADAAAVVFTRHPVTQRTDHLLVNAVRGMGEALVSGTVTPDEMVLDKETLRTVAFTAGNGTRVLDDEQLRALASESLRLEAAFGAPIDIEAAHAAGRWHILQARPITA